METEHKVPTLEELQKMSEEYGVKVIDGSQWFKAIGIVGGVSAAHMSGKSEASGCIERLGELDKTCSKRLFKAKSVRLGCDLNREKYARTRA
jgi:hypothetical protein